LLASHDTARLISIAQGDKASVELATVLLLTFPGAPSIYYGDEVGLPGKLDPDSRRGFPMETHWDVYFLKSHQRLIALRHKYPALRTGSYHILYAEGTTYVFARILGNEEIIVAINVGTTPANVSFEVTALQSQPSHLLYGDAEISWNQEGGKSKQLNLNLPPRTGCIFGPVE
ncbi:MAG TPA: alpha-amylase family glycosyl hydrolase, partial [Phormidium sp.]